MHLKEDPRKDYIFISPCLAWMGIEVGVGVGGGGGGVEVYSAGRIGVGIGHYLTWQSGCRMQTRTCIKRLSRSVLHLNVLSMYFKCHDCKPNIDRDISFTKNTS